MTLLSTTTGLRRQQTIVQRESIHQVLEVTFIPVFIYWTCNMHNTHSCLLFKAVGSLKRKKRHSVSEEMEEEPRRLECTESEGCESDVSDSPPKRVKSVIISPAKRNIQKKKDDGFQITSSEGLNSKEY